VELHCSAQTAWDRKKAAEAGTGFESRSHRNDIDQKSFERKINSYYNDTLPLLAFYERCGSTHIRIPITVSTSPAEIVSSVCSRQSRWIL
jgi:hypothetical protein